MCIVTIHYVIRHLVLWIIMIRVSIDDENANSLEELTGKKLSKNGNELIAEVIEMAEANKKPDSPCWVESNGSEQDKEEVGV